VEAPAWVAEDLAASAEDLTAVVAVAVNPRDRETQKWREALCPERC